MIDFARALRQHRVSLALGTSTLALSLGLPSTAHAQCAPDPTVANGTTTCSDADTDGIRVTTSGTTLTVANGASVSNSGAAAITIDAPNASYYGGTTILVDGKVTGGTDSAITLLTGPVSSYNGTTRLALTVAEGATVSGSTALTTAQSPDNIYGELLTTIDNAGTLTGSSGTALRGDTTTTYAGYTSNFSAFDSITNRATGVINGTVAGPVGTLNNAGLIDGVSDSALTFGNASGYPYTIYSGIWTNTGTIRSNSSAATIASTPMTSLVNSGTIANAGSGAAIASSYLFIENQAGGQISSAGTTAIATTGINLVNAGTISGDVLTGNSNSLVDSSQGHITGSVVFGTGYNTLVVGYDGTAVVTGITGTITAGGGVNTEQLAVTTDTTIATPITQLAGFQQFVIATDAGVTTTLGAGFVPPAATTIQVAGAGTLVNRAAIVTDGTAFALNGVSPPALETFVNDGSIRTTSTTLAAVTGAFYTQITNNGSILSAGAAIRSSGSVANTGTIIAASTGVVADSAGLTNTGLIRSTGGVGISLSGNQGTTSYNSGTIQGATFGAALAADLINTGTITATNGNGTAVQLDYYSTLYNHAGGVVGDGGSAISGNGAVASVINAGTINGTVALTLSDASAGGYNGQRYISQAGGVLNGNLVLGGGATLFTDLAGTGDGRFAGITGTVTAASGALLRLRVTGEQSATIGPIGPFASATYELTDGANLTLSASGTVTSGLSLAGSGTVDLNADLATSTTTPALAVVGTLADKSNYGAGNSALSITSRGMIATSRAVGGDYSGPAVSLGSGDSFTNLGTITVTDYNPTSYAAGISGGATVTNTGAILLDGGTAIVGDFGGTTVVNTGTITQIGGGATANGLAGSISLDNSGTISVGGLAVAAYNRNQIVNSGTITSTGGIAIGGSDTSASAYITNATVGTITGTGGTAVRLYAGTFTNAGTVTGTVDMGYGYPYYSGASPRSYAGSTYVAAGGTITGDLLFGDGADLLLQTGDTLGVSGIVDGGAGTDIYGRALASSGTVALDLSNVRNFEDALVQAVGTDTVVTTTASGTFGGSLYAVGNGSVVNAAAITGMLTTALPYLGDNPSPIFPTGQMLSSLTNTGSIAGGVYATTLVFTNSGTISSSDSYDPTVSVYSGSTLAFTNSGTISQATAISSDPYYGDRPGTTVLLGGSNLTIRNSGQITGALYGTAYQITDASPTSIDFANSGTITSSAATAVALWADSYYADTAGTVRIENSGTISEQNDATSGVPTTGLSLSASSIANPTVYAITNSGNISATATGASRYTDSQTIAMQLSGTGLTGTITNAAGGAITADGENAYGLVITDSALNLTNAGTIRATGSTASIAIAAFDTFDNSIVNTGTIIGDILFTDGADTVDNAGTITGAIALGAGDDSFTQRGGSSVSGLIDGGGGTDRYVVDTTGGTATLAAAQIANFESVTQTGTGTGLYSGSFGVDTITLAGGTLVVGAGQTLTTAGATTITGGDAGVSIINAGRIGGAVKLGAGDDSYTEMAGSSAGLVDGGGGTNLYRTILAGDRTGLGARTNFEQLSIEGTGTLTLALDQDFQSVALAGTNLTTALDGFTIGRIDGSAAAEAVTLDGDVAAVALGGGNDLLSLGATTLAGRYDGGDGTDALRLTAAGPVTLTGSAVNFETVSLAGGALTVAGTLGSSGSTLAFGDGAQALTVAAGGTLAGTIDLGSGEDSFTLARGGTLAGTVAGGAGIDTATLDFANGFTLKSGTLTGFERLVAQGNGALTLAGGAFAYDTASVAGDLTIAADASLAARQVTFGPADNHMTIAGGFAGSVAGGAGTGSIDVSGGSAAAPVAFATLSDIEALRVSAGFSTVSGTATLGLLALTGGRLVGLAGSTIAAPTITVGTNATFGSAGTVTGNLMVNGTLSPGASPSTMTVNGNVALAGSSVSLFEITPSVSDKLIVNGTVSIAQGATLQLAATQRIAPGGALDLIVASGGITGSYTNVVRPDSLFGVIVQDGDKISLLGEFLNEAAFSPQVQRSIAYVNSVLMSDTASDALLAAAPQLVSASGASNQAAFGRLTPEAYASADQITVEQGLTLADTGRSAAFGTNLDTPGAFTFGSTLGNFRTLDSGAQGTSRAQTSSYGFLGGIGWGSGTWSIGGFLGYLSSRQTLATLGARTKVDGVVAGAHGRWSDGRVGVKATIAYDGGNAKTTRALPGASVEGRYDRHGWTADVSVDYAMRLTGNWTVRPSLGATAVLTSRDRVAETGGSAFALDLARMHDHAVFVDGAMTFSGGTNESAILRPYLSVGARYQVDGRTPYALAALGGGGYGLLAAGAQRASVLATATIGTDVIMSSRWVLFGGLSGESGDADHRASGHVGLRLRF